MPTILTDQTPLTGTNVSDSTLYTLGLEWTSDADGAWLGVRVFTPTSAIGADYQVVGYSVDTETTGTELGRGSAPWAGPGAWQTILFATPVPITAGEHYCAAYVTPDFFVLTNHGCDAAIVNGHLSSYANGDGAALNGRIHISGDAFPELGSGNAALYFADPVVSFQTTIALGIATETDTARPITASKHRTIAAAIETDIALPIQAPGRAGVGLEVTLGQPHIGWQLGKPAAGWTLGAPTI